MMKSGHDQRDKLSVLDSDVEVSRLTVQLEYFNCACIIYNHTPQQYRTATIFISIINITHWDSINIQHENATQAVE